MLLIKGRHPWKKIEAIFGKHVCQSLKGIKDKRSKELVKMLNIKKPFFSVVSVKVHWRSSTPFGTTLMKFPTLYTIIAKFDKYFTVEVNETYECLQAQPKESRSPQKFRCIPDRTTKHG